MGASAAAIWSTVAANAPTIAAVATAANVVNGVNQANAQNKASKQNAAALASQQQVEGEQLKAANSQQPTLDGLIQRSAKGSTGGTLLTGPQGVAPSSLTLGKTTLLGGG